MFTKRLIGKYAYSESNNVLVQITGQEVFYDVKKNESKVTLTFADGMKTEYEDAEFKLIPLYETEDEFKKWNQWCGYVGSDNYDELIDLFDKRFDSVHSHAYIFENGQAKYVNLFDVIKTFEYNYNTRELKLNEGCPKFYKTAEDCLRWNEYVIHEDGKEPRTEVGLYKLLQLTDKQQEKFNELKRVFEECKEMNIKFAYNLVCYEEFIAFNNEVADCTYDIENIDGVHICDIPVGKVLPNRIFIDDINEDSVFYIKSKQNETD